MEMRVGLTEEWAVTGARRARSNARRLSCTWLTASAPNVPTPRFLIAPQVEDTARALNPPRLTERKGSVEFRCDPLALSNIRFPNGEWCACPVRAARFLVRGEIWLRGLSLSSNWLGPSA